MVDVINVYRYMRYLVTWDKDKRTATRITDGTVYERVHPSDMGPVLCVSTNYEYVNGVVCFSDDEISIIRQIAVRIEERIQADIGVDGVKDALELLFSLYSSPEDLVAYWRADL